MLKDLASSYPANTEFDLKVSYLPLLETTLVSFMNLALYLTCKILHADSLKCVYQPLQPVLLNKHQALFS